MTTWIDANPNFLKPRDKEAAIDAIAGGGVVIVPSDSGYTLVCGLGQKSAVQRIRQIRDLDKSHPFTIACSDLTHLARYAQVDNVQFRVLKRLFPGAFTCILPASREVPRLVMNEKRKTIGIRVPDQVIFQSLIEGAGEALMGISLCKDQDAPVSLADLPTSVTHAVDVVIDIGDLVMAPSTVLDLTVMPPEILRQGQGDASIFLG